MQENALLEMRDISKEFPGVKALDKVSLTVRPGTVHALMGENGAGKSTLMKCLFGIYSKDGGTIVLDGKEVNFKSSKEALENGVAMVHQELNQALTRSVQDNLWLGRYPTVGGIMVSEGIMRKKTKEIFSDLEVDIAGKTGTAEELKNGHIINHAFFVSFAPYQDPEIAVTVNIPYGYSSSNAATAAKNIYRYYYGYTDLDYILNNSALNVSNVEIGD